MGSASVDALIRRIELLERTVLRQQVRLNNMVREGVVESVDEAGARAVVNAHGIPTKAIPWMQQAGAINEWTPPSVGQRVAVISPSGDLGRGFILPGGFTDDVPQPHNKLAEKRIKIGDAVWTQSASGLLLQVGGTTFSWSERGYVQDGGALEHDGKNIGATHKHTNVFPGGGVSGVPTGAGP